jgi:peptide/nickel transport system substrate-binding protein
MTIAHIEESGIFCFLMRPAVNKSASAALDPCLGLTKCISKPATVPLRVVVAICLLFAFSCIHLPAEDLLIRNNPTGHSGGRLVVSLRSEPKTLNPVTSVDISSREVIAQMAADLIHIDRLSQQAEPALAKSWKVSADGLQYTLKLRQGLRFSDGQPLTAEDVLFSFNVYLDENVHSPQRDALIIAGKPITVRSVDAETLVFQLAKPYAAAERLFDSLAILPKHLLEQSYKEGKLAQAWGIGTSPQQIAGLGPFRLKDYVAGQYLTLERNPYFWKIDREKHRLPYLDQITFLFVQNADAEVIRFQAGDTDIINRISAEDYSVLEKDQTTHSFRVYDVGPSLEYNFLFFNLNSVLPPQSDIAGRQNWFRQVKFRQAVSLAIDREGITRLVYRGRATPLWTPVTPASSFWIDNSIPHPPRSIEQARQLLQSSGFTWSRDGDLIDASGSQIKFSILTSASNSQRTQMATIIQQDLKELGIAVQVAPLEFRSFLDRIFQTHDYDAAIMGLGAGDVDPNSQMNVWLSSGNDHVWDLGETHPSSGWEAEIDQLMDKQISTLKPESRKRLYDRVQEIIATNLPVISLVSPNTLVAAKDRLSNFSPAVIDPHTLWNSQELFLSTQKSGGQP